MKAIRANQAPARAGRVRVDYMPGAAASRDSLPTKSQASTPSVEGSKNTLQIKGRPGVSEARQLADLATDGIATNAITATTYLGATQPNVSLTEMVASLQEHGKRVNDNDLSAAEQMLTAQAIALNAIFAEMARRAALNMGQHIDAMEKYMRLALKAQGQSRATVETLAAIQNPPVVYAKQANITSGPQQVNNGVPTPTMQACGEPLGMPAHEQSGKTANELLRVSDDTRMDAGAPGAAGFTNPGLATVGLLHGAEVRGRTRQSLTK
jgi:hypothetical protein